MQETIQSTIKNNIIRFWLTHHYLRKVGKRYPVFFAKLMEEITDNLNEIRVMKERYVLNKKFEVIALDMNVDTRYVFRLHRQAIDKLISL